MHAIEFEADIEDGVIRIPKSFNSLDKAHARVIVLTEEKQTAAAPFDPKAFFDAADQTKKEIDAYMQEVREGWK